MSWVILFFFFSYGGFHYYFLTRLRTAVHLSLPALTGTIFFLTMMVLSPFLVYFLERYAGRLSARVFAFFSYSWMGFIFLFFCIALLFDFYHLVLYVAARLLRSDFPSLLSLSRWSFSFSVVCSLVICTYGLFEAADIRTTRLTISSTKLPASLGRIRIVQISDLHIGLIVQGSRLRRVIGKIKETHPDMLVSTGDLVDGQEGADMEAQYAKFADITPPLGKFAVTGNHEYYAGLERSLEFTRRAGFVPLRSETRTINESLSVAGLDDIVVRRGSDEPVAGYDRLQEALAQLSRDRFTLFLYHRPTVMPEYLDAFDLQLSGHTHKGQIFPFSLVTRLLFPMQSGFYTLSPRSTLYASRGTGTWGPPIRFLAPPEITVIDLVPATAD